MPPYVTNVPSAQISAIDFSSAQAKKRKLDDPGQRAAKKKKTAQIATPTQQEWASFLENIKKTNVEPSALSITKGYSQDFIPLEVKHSTALLTSLTRNAPPSNVMAECEMFAKAFKTEEKVKYSAYFKRERLQVQLHFASLEYVCLYLSLVQVCEEIERSTKQQSGTPLWFAFRAGRVTASTAHAACHTPLLCPSLSLVKRMCYPDEHSFSCPATEWGRAKEKVAREAYIAEASKRHFDFRCEQSGLHISSTHPFLAASPDGLVSCACCSDGIVEVKCPFKAQSVEEASQRKNSCLERCPDGILRLKRRHAYFCQVQVQLFACQRNYCDFVLWTLSDFHLERISIDPGFCSETVEKCKKFFESVLLPELLFQHWTSRPQVESGSDVDGDLEPQYCYCGRGEFGDMVECSGRNCQGKWFHFACANLKRAPKARAWFCKHCKPQKAQR